MGRNQRDEPYVATIADSTDTSATDQKAPVNAALDALEEASIMVRA